MGGGERPDRIRRVPIERLKSMEELEETKINPREYFFTKKEESVELMKNTTVENLEEKAQKDYFAYNRAKAINTLYEKITHYHPQMKENLGKLCVSVLQRDRAESPKIEAAKALGTIGNEKHLPHLFKALENTKSPTTKSEIIKAIRKITVRVKDEKILPYLINASKKPNVDTKVAALKSMSIIKSPKVSAEAIKELKNENNRVHEAALDTLKKVKICEEAQKNQIKEMLESSDKNIQKAGIEAVGVLRLEEFIPKLKELFEKTNLDSIKQSVVGALSEFKNKEAIKVLESILLNVDSKEISESIKYAIKKASKKSSRL